jgi:hypothetical protein
LTRARRRRVARVALLASLLAPAAALAESDRVELRADCPRDADDTCFSDLSTLDHWLFEAPRPSAAEPVTVHVGEGEFRGRVLCRAQGVVHFRGADRARSRLIGTVDEFPFATVRAEGCMGLRFERLTIVGPHSNTGRGKALYWSGAGESLLRDVTLEAEYVAWYDSNCGKGNSLPPTGTHRFEQSLLRAGGVGVFSDCGRLVVSESEIEVAPDADTTLPFLGPGLKDVVAGVKVSHRSRTELVGSRVSVDATHAPGVAHAIGLLAGAAGNHHPLGAGLVEMRGGALRVRGTTAIVQAVRAERFDQSEALPARVRVIGASLELLPAEAARLGGDGVVEWLEPSPR